MRLLVLVVLVSAGLTLISSPTRAEWLSLRDGGLLETKGPWTEKGKMIVYTAATGPLMSLRASEVDLAMSKAIGSTLKKSRFTDLGTTADPTDPEEHQAIVDKRGDDERNNLKHFVRDPNAQRVSGTLSAVSDAAFDRAECSGRFRGSSAYDVCMVRASIKSETRRAEEGGDAEEFVDHE